MKIINRVCAFTGHRPSKLPWRYEETDPRCRDLKTILTKQIQALVEANVTQFLSGMAEGTDIFCSEIVLALREKNPAIKLHAILPCTTQAEQWSASSRERYYSILKQADSVVYVRRDYHKDCMLERNRFMVDRATVLLAVYSGTGRSGTGATVNYARRTGREIIVIDPATLHITREGPASNTKL